MHVVARQNPHNKDLWSADATAWTRPADWCDSKIAHTANKMWTGTRKETMFFALGELQKMLHKEWLKTQYTEHDGQYYMFGSAPRKQEK